MPGISFLSVAVIKHHDLRQFKEEIIYLSLWFQRKNPNCEETQAAGGGSKNLRDCIFNLKQQADRARWKWVEATTFKVYP